ncbi:MAG TPA: SIS domain-containing protein [Kiritimatiellia bacterium]|nr:SIS domain-containing protein [Kiritimatiellia bacterium]HMO98294.1 SIS domain-containing protein [Kiritimatiellia bacterium]
MEQNFIERHLRETADIVAGLDRKTLRGMVDVLLKVRANGGRLFFLGVGGSAANASHAVNDFRKLAGFESYCPTDNVSELTARTNDEGWATVFAAWLKVSRLNASDALFIMSVGGGDEKNNVSPNLVEAIRYAKHVGASIVGIVGRDGGYTAREADACVIIPTVNAESITPHTEAFHAVVWHLLITHPEIKINATKWESLVK